MWITDTRPGAVCGRGGRRCYFTLVELMVAMVVLVVLMGMLFAILSGAQEAYSLADSNALIYEKAHVLFEQLSRDLRSAVTSEVPGREVPIWVAEVTAVHDPTDYAKRDMICAVVAGPAPNTAAESGLQEVRYAFHTDDSQPNANVVTRSCAGDKNTDGTPNARWDFYGRTAATVEDADSDGVPDWADDSQPRQAVVGGVEEFKLEPYPAFTGTRNTLPKAFVVTITIVDERALSLPEPVRTQRLDESRRTFRKVIFVGGED